MLFDYCKEMPMAKETSGRKHVTRVLITISEGKSMTIVTGSLAVCISVVLEQLLRAYMLR